MMKKVILLTIALSAIIYAGTTVGQLPPDYPATWEHVTSDQFIIGTSLDRFNIRFFDANGVATHDGKELIAEIPASHPAFNHMLATALAGQAKGRISCVLALKTSPSGGVYYDILMIDITY